MTDQKIEMPVELTAEECELVSGGDGGLLNGGGRAPLIGSGG